MIDIESFIELMTSCEAGKFWGSVNFNFVDGEMTNVDVRQTLRPQKVNEISKVLIFRSLKKT